MCMNWERTQNSAAQSNPQEDTREIYYEIE